LTENKITVMTKSYAAAMSWADAFDLSRGNDLDCESVRTTIM